MPLLIHQAMTAQAALNPDHEAFRHGQETLSFAELETRSNQLAHLLIAEGVQRGDRVGIFAGRNIESAVAVYGILKAGGAFVPLNALAPPAATSRIIQFTGIKHLVGHPSTAPALQRLFTETAPSITTLIGVQIEAKGTRQYGWEEVTSAARDYPTSVSLSEEDIAYIISTSGSTGEPKGITHTHRSGYHYAALSKETYDIRPEDRIGSHSPLHFDMATLGYLTGPFAGATTVLVPEAHTKLPASLSALTSREKITIWYSVPSALLQLLSRGVLEERDLSSLRWVLYGGEPFPPERLHELRSVWRHVRFSNVYGPAEVNQCTYFHLPPQSEDENEPNPSNQIPIGRAWGLTELQVVDDKDEPVPTGSIGELLVCTPTMMRGYWARPDLDAQSFAKRPLGNSGQIGLFYRTRDLVRTSSDGNLLFVGRKDRLLKIRGHRVEPEEVEHILISHPAVSEAAVFGVVDGGGEIILHVQVIASDNETPGAENLLAFLAAQLPAYSVPNNLEFTTSLPRAESGKIDYAQLSRDATSTVA